MFIKIIIEKNYKLFNNNDNNSKKATLRKLAELY